MKLFKKKLDIITLSTLEIFAMSINLFDFGDLVGIITLKDMED